MSEGAMINNKVLVTGASGFLGKHVVFTLVDQGYKVVGVGRKNMEAFYKDSSCIYKFVDLSEEKMDEQIGNDFNYIVHVAALSTDDAFDEEYEKHNNKVTDNIIHFAKRNPLLRRVVYISTPSIYFNCNSKLNVSENEVDPMNFVNAYARTKYECEVKFKESGINTIVLRPRAIYGEYDTTLLPKLLKVSRVGIPLFYKGIQMVDFSYAGNVAHAVDLALKAPDEINGHVYNVTDGESKPLKDVYKLLESVLEKKLRKINLNYNLCLKAVTIIEQSFRRRDKKPPITRYAISVLGNSQTLDINRIKAELGYQPPYTTEEGMKRFAQWYKRGNQ